MVNIETEKILDFPVVIENKNTCFEYLNELISSKERGGLVACLNPHSIVVSQSDSDFRNALIGANLLLPDGIGIVLASRLCGGAIKKRITGSDLFYSVNSVLNRTHGSVFFLGSTEKNLVAIRKKMAKVYPKILVAGTYSPPFKEKFSATDSATMVEAVNKTKPDVLWVGMTAPKQEKWAYKNLDVLDVGLIGAVGAVFDFFIGNVKRSHPIFREIGLEWLPRLIRQPGRLWKRNLISSPLFMFYILRSYAQKLGS